MADLDNEIQWAAATRGRTSQTKFVATRSLSHHGQKITAGLTRCAEGHPWLLEIPSAFSRLDSEQGRAAVRSREGGTTRGSWQKRDTKLKRYPWQL